MSESECDAERTEGLGPGTVARVAYRLLSQVLRGLWRVHGQSVTRASDTYAHIALSTRDVAMNRVAEIVIRAPEL